MRILSFSMLLLFYSFAAICQINKFPDGLYLNIEQFRNKQPIYNIDLSISMPTLSDTNLAFGNNYIIESGIDSLNSEYLKKNFFAYVKKDTILLNSSHLNFQSGFVKTLSSGNYLSFKSCLTIVDSLPCKNYLNVLSLRTKRVDRLNKDYIKSRLVADQYLLDDFNREKEMDSEKILIKYINKLNLELYSNIELDTSKIKEVKNVNDFENVFIIQKGNMNPFLKISDVTTVAQGTTLFSEKDNVSNRAYNKLKKITAMLGANILLLTSDVSSNNILRSNAWGPGPVQTNLSGVAYTNKLPGYIDFTNTIGDKREFECLEKTVLSKMDSDISKTEFPATIKITEIYNVEDMIMIKAKINGVNFTSFRVIDFSKYEFTLVCLDKNGVYNFRIKI